MDRIWADNDSDKGRFRKRHYENLGKITQRFFHRFRPEEETQTSHSKINSNAKEKAFFPVLLVRFLPILQWLPQYRWHDSFFADLSAGLTMAVFSVPTGGFAILSLMTRSAIEKVYRLTQHVQLLHSTASLTNVTNSTTPATAFFATTITHAVNLATSLAVGGALLVANNNSIGSLSPTTQLNNDSAVSSLNVTAFEPFPDTNSLNDNATEAAMVVNILSGANDTDSMVFGLAANSENSNSGTVSDKVNPFFEDSVGFENLASANIDSEITLAKSEDTPISITKFDDATNLTMVILQENGTDKAAAIFINSQGGVPPSGPSAAALVAAASKAVAGASAASGRGTLQKKSIILDSVSLTAAASTAAPSTTQLNTPTMVTDLKPIQIATTILFVSGILQILMGLLRVDFLSCYLSEQIMSGFVVGGCVHVFFSQIGDILGISLPQRSGRGYLYNRLMDLIAHWHEAHPPTTIISGCSISFLLFSQRILEPWLASVFRFPIPYELILVILGITATNFAKLSKRHSITVVGHVPTNFPTPSLPRFDLISLIFFDAVSITVTAVAIHLTVVKIVESRYHYKVNSCQELYSLGLSGLLASFFPVFPVTSVFARTLIGEADENCTQMTIFFSSMTLLAVILYVGPVLEYLPKCILASMVLVSLSASLSKFQEIRALWPLFKFDFIIFLVSFSLTICYGMAEGLTFTVIFAIFTIVVRDQWPKWHFLSHDEECNEFRETPKEQIHELNSNGACVLRYDAPLIFPNVHKFLKVVEQGVKQWEKRQLYQAGQEIHSNSLKSNSSVVSITSNSTINDSNDVSDATAAVAKCVGHRLRGGNVQNSDDKNHFEMTRRRSTTLIIDCSGFPYVDYLGLCTLKRVYLDFMEQDVAVKFAAPKAILMRIFRDTDFMEVVPASHIFSTVRHAVDSITTH